MSETRLAARALVIEPDGTGEVREIPTDLVGLQAIVDGYLQGVTFSGCHLYCDEDGKYSGKQPNPAATTLAHALGWPRGDLLAGTVVFLGNGPAGGEGDLPAEVIELWNHTERTEAIDVSVKVTLDYGIDPDHPIVEEAVREQIVRRLPAERERTGKMPTTLDLRGFHFGHGLTTLVAELPACDIHEANGDDVQAIYDAKTRQGPWANLCAECFARMGIQLGTGYGQRLIPRTEETA